MRHKKKVAARKKAKKKLTPEQITAKSAIKYGVPFWILWGIAGAESTWGQGGSNLFGLMAAAEGADVSNWKSASEQAAKTLAGLKRRYGSWSKAIEHYSGDSYDISHPAQLAAEQGVTPKNERKVLKRVLSGATTPVDLTEGLSELGGAGKWLWENFGEGGLLEHGPKGKVLGPPGALDENAEKAGGAAVNLIPTPITEAFKDFDAVAKLLVSPQFWVRVGEAIGGIILLYLALKALTGLSVPGEGAAKSYAKGAAFKKLPPSQKVSS